MTLSSGGGGRGGGAADEGAAAEGTTAGVARPTAVDGVSTKGGDMRESSAISTTGGRKASAMGSGRCLVGSTGREGGDGGPPDMVVGCLGE